MTGSLKRLNRKLIEHDLFEFTLFFIISIESDPFDSNKSGSTSFAYDAKGQVAQKTQNIEGVELTKTYVYNDEGKLISETYPSGAVIAYTYNVDEVQSISIDGNPYMTDISYNAANQLIGWNWADGTPYAKTYDANARLSTFPLANDTRTLAYDANGNITGWTDNGKTEAKSFAYDALNRLTDYNKADVSTTLEDQLFSYDPNGNRTQLLDGSVQTIYNILAESNRLEQVGATQYQYDANGNIIDDGEHSYSYDARNRLTAVDGTSAYLFNASNMRVKKTTPAGTVLYGWDNDRIFAEYDDQGNAIQETVYFGSMPVALLKDGNTYRIFADQINTPRVITDRANTVLWAWDSKPFGESVPNEDADADGTNLSYNLRFPGQYYDVETEKHYNFNRDYNPVTGRYIQSDPIGLDGGTNAYSYALNSPLSKLDSLGTFVQVVMTGTRTVDITLPITYTGSVGNTARGMNLTIERFWTGTFGVYTVTTRVTAGTNNTINMINQRYDVNNRTATSGVSHVMCAGDVCNTGTWNLFDFGTDAPWGWTAAHEAGHLMGLKDRYHPVTGVVYSHGVGHIMGETNGATVEQADIWNIIEYSRRIGTLVQN